MESTLNLNTKNFNHSIQNQELSKVQKYVAIGAGALVGAAGICMTTALSTMALFMSAMSCDNPNSKLCASAGSPLIPIAVIMGGTIVTASLADSARRLTETGIRAFQNRAKIA